jgi:uncharacterized membrane protein YfcA
MPAMESIQLIIVLGVGLIAGSYGTLVGGGSLITIPTLIFLGFPPHTAIGTNKLGVMGNPTAGWYEFNRKGIINYKIGFIMGIPAFIGPILGASFVLQINETILKRLIAVITIIILTFLIARPEIGTKKAGRAITKQDYIIGAFLSFLISIYSGFYGAGAGTLLTYVLILFFGQTFLEGAATRKIAQFISTAMAIVIFAIGGFIHYPLGIALFIGNLIGSYIGAHYSDKIGNIWIKRLFIAIVLIMAVKLLY